MARVDITIHCDMPEVHDCDIVRLERRVGDPEILWNVMEDLECDRAVEEVTAEIEIVEE